jgi:predicted ferric reductase
VLFSFALWSFAYRLYLHRFFVKKIVYTVVQKILLPDGITEIVLTPVEKKLQHKPGQFVFLSINSLGIDLAQHPFSIASGPEEENLTISIKSLGDYTETIQLIREGATVEVEGPYGRFSYAFVPNRFQVWIAGGIGITPFLSMVKNLAYDSEVRAILYYVVKDESEAVYRELLQAYAESFPNALTFRPYFSKIEGRCSPEIIAKEVSDIAKRELFVCGPPAMMQSMRSGFVKMGHKNSHIHTEEFSLSS